MSRYRMYKYILQPIAGKNHWYLQIWMCDTYTPILTRCFPDISFKLKPGASGTCFAQIVMTERQVLSVQNLLEIFKNHILLVKNKHIEPHFSNELDQCFALGFNLTDNEETGGVDYTKYGRLEHLAKEEESSDARDELVDALSEICKKRPLYNQAEIVMPVPPNPSKTYHLPVLLTKELAQKTGKKDGSELISKVKETPRLQELPVDKKLDALKGAIEITGSMKGKDVIIVDDLYQSGFTLWSIANLLKQKGAKSVLGLVCVKSRRDTDNQ